MRHAQPLVRLDDGRVLIVLPQPATGTSSRSRCTCTSSPSRAHRCCARIRFLTSSGVLLEASRRRVRSRTALTAHRTARVCGDAPVVGRHRWSYSHVLPSAGVPRPPNGTLLGRGRAVAQPPAHLIVPVVAVAVGIHVPLTLTGGPQLFFQGVHLGQGRSQALGIRLGLVHIRVGGDRCWQNQGRGGLAFVSLCVFARGSR